MINCLIDAAKERKCLPRYLIVVPDKDISDMTNFDEHAMRVLKELVRYLIRQVDTLVRRCKAKLLEKKPGAITGFSPKIIFMKMIRRVGHFHPDSKMFNISRFRPKFNDSLNDAIVKIDQYILTIASCSTYEHFDIDGNLSAKGKRSF